MLYRNAHLLVFIALHYVCRSATQQRVDIQGRPYVGFVSEYYYPIPKCVAALQLLAEESLTGAEEIDLLYASCPGDTLRLAHYRNDESLFTFFEPLSLSRLIVASHQHIRLTELHLIECDKPAVSRNCDESTEHQQHKKRRRHKHHKTKEIRIEERRRKRQSSFSYGKDGSPHAISEKITIPSGESLTIQTGARLNFAPDAGIEVHGSLTIAGTDKEPVYLAASGTRWAGIQFRAGYDASATSLSYVNITGAKVGLSIDRGAEPPTMKNVVIDGARKGVVVDTQRGDGLHRITGVTAANSLDSGFTILGEGDVQFDDCLSSSNGLHGFDLLTSGSISIYSSSAFSNAYDGISLNGSNSLRVEDSLLGGNGAAGMRVVRSTTSSSDLFTLHLRAVNITSHFYDPAILLTTADNMDFLLSESIIYENSNGALIFGGTTAQSQIQLISNRWVKNSGPIVHFGLVQGGTILVDNNLFEENRGKLQREAILEVMSEAEADVTIVIRNNTFKNNQIEGAIRFEVMGGRQPKATISRNAFVNNQATVVVDVAVLTAPTVSGNQFGDPQSSCELAAVREHKENTFPANAQNARCDLRVGSRSTARPTATGPAMLSFPALTGTYNQIKKGDAPYVIDSNLDIPADTIVVVEAGSDLGFYGDHGVAVHGKLYINGTPSQPVELFGGDGSPWRGIQLEKGGRLFLSNVVIRDAQIGALLNSDDVIFHNVTFIRSLKHAVETGPGYCQGEICILDLGNSTIRDTFGSALYVDKRDKAVPLTVANGNFIGNSETAIEFQAPSGEITVNDVLIRDGGGNGVSIEEQDNMAGLEAVRIERLRVEDEERGDVGLFISSKRVKKVEILDSTFERNTVPSMVVDLDMTSPVSFFNISGNRFRNNSHVVTALSCVGCASGQISRNEWSGNNPDHDGSALFVEFKRNEDQEKEPSILIDNNRFDGNSGESTLAFSSDHEREIAAVLYNNTFERSNNSRAVLISDTPDASLHRNTFTSKTSMFDVEVMFPADQGRQLNATQNQWSSDPPDILDGNHSKNKGYVNLGSTPALTSLPTLLPPIVSVDCATVNYCTGHGRCVGPSLCLCDAGWSSPTCSLRVPTCPLNCSGHGACVGSQCLCELGWIGQSCEVATCSGVGDCSSHGVCVGKDKCECADGWAGPRCDQPECSKDSCSHGTCEGASCKCQKGWSGPSCSFPLCATNCSLNGVCSAPYTCSCFEDFTGDNCEKCASDACRLCNVPCVNGNCDGSGQVCICSAGWTGASCDVCSSASICSVRSAILFLLPSTGDPTVPGGIVNVHTAILPRSSGRYSCVFGSVSSNGQQVSPSLVRCPLPANLPVGRHLFNLWPEGAATPIPHVDKRPIHFTAYTTCLPSLCQGKCLGPICMCPKGKAGPMCQFAQVVPSIDRQFISESSTTTASEEKAYVVQLPQVSSSILRLASDAPGLRLDESRSLLVWDLPRGRETPYNVTVIMASPGGDTTFSWPLTVPVTYSAVIDRVVKEERKRRYLVEGRIVGAKTRKDVPVTVTFARSDGSEEDREVKADANGRFSLYWTPPAGSAEFNVIATHPGEKVDESNQGVSLRVQSTSIEYDKDVTEEELKKGIEYKFMTEDSKGEWSVDVLFPTVNIVAETMKLTTQGARIAYRIKKPFSGNLVVLFIRGEEKIVASHSVLTSPSEGQISLASSPSSITFNANDNSRNELVRVSLASLGAPLTSPLSLSFSSSPPPFTLLFSEPPLEEYRQYSKTRLVLWLVPTGTGPISGTMKVQYGRDTIHQIPYSVVSAPSPFMLRICLRDSALSSQTPSSSTDAEMTLARAANNAVTVRQATVNGAAEEFEIVPGFYQLRVTSREYTERMEMIYVSSSNTSFCVDLSPVHADLLPSWSEERGVRVEMTGSQMDSPLPLLLFSPSALTDGDHEIEMTVHARKGTIIALLSLTSEHVQYLPSSSSTSSLLEDGDVVRLQMRVSTSSIKNDDCDGVLIPIPFVYESEDVSSVGESQLVVMKKQTEGQPRICSSTSPSSPLPLSLSTSILCDCASGARNKCRQKYHGAAGCGDAWRAIPDDTISTEILALFLSLTASCTSMGIRMEEIYEATKCIGQLEAVCPINRKIAVIPVQGTGVYATRNTDASNSPPLSLLLPVFRVLDLQSVALAGVYNEFFEKLELVFPSSNYSSMSPADFAHFIDSISDNSELGQWISEKETERIKNGSALLSRWNASMSEWRSGKLHPFAAAAATSDVIDYAAAKQLVVAADRLKALARQQGAANPFSLLHDYVNRVLSAGGGGDPDGQAECATAHVYLSHVEIAEDEQFTVRVMVRNERKDTALDNVELTLDLVRDDPYQSPLKFRIGPFIYTGIRSLGGSHSLGPSQSFDATWTVVPVAERRLVREAHYQAIITLSFSSSGHSTLMRLSSPRLLVVPRPSLKLLYFLPPPSSQGTEAETIVSIVNTGGAEDVAMVSIVNTGYRPLTGLRIEGAQINVANERNVAMPYSINSVSLRDSSDHVDVPRDRLIGPIPTIPSGRAMQMKIQLGLRNNGKLRSLFLTPSLDGATLRLEDTRSFTVLTKPGGGDEDGGLLVSPLGQSAPVYYYTPTDAKLQNIAGLKLIQSRWDSSTTDGKEFIRVQAAMQSNESPDFASTLWGRVELPKLPANYKLLRVREVGAGVSPLGRGVGGEKWIEQRDGKQFVNWIDSGAIPRGGNINYEFVFGDPKDFEQPIFAQDLYRIQVLPEFWPQPGTVVGEIRATSPIDKPLTYSLYSRNGDETWAVNPNTGQIVLANRLRRGEESCLTMVVKDAEGRQSTVPVAVNTGTAALPCPVITDFDHLTPLIWNPTAPTVVPTWPTAPVTGTGTRPTAGSTEPPIFTASPSTMEPDTVPTAPPTTVITSGTVPPATTAPPILTASPSTREATTVITSGTVSQGTTVDPAWTWMTTAVPSVTPDSSLPTIAPTTGGSIGTIGTIRTIGTIGTMGTAATEDWISAVTRPTDVWEQPSTITSSGSSATSAGSTLTSLTPSGVSTMTRPSPISTTEPPTHSHSPDPSLEPATTILIPWGSTPVWTSTIFPTSSEHSEGSTQTSTTLPSPVTTDDYVEYTTEPATRPTDRATIVTEFTTHATHPTHIVSPLPTLITVPVTLPTPAPTHSFSPDGTIATLVPATTPSTAHGSIATEEPFTLFTVPTDSGGLPTTPGEDSSTITTSGEGSTVTTSDETLTTSEGEHSTRGLAVEACRLKGTAPIWGVICDLSKTVKTV